MVQSSRFNLFLGASAAISLSAGLIAGQINPHKNDRVLAKRLLPEMDGSRPRATLVEVSYGPQMSSPPHTHGCPVIGYVLTGTIRFQINKDPELLLHAGDIFYEGPNSVHNVSANASKTESAKFLAFFVCGGHQNPSAPAGKDGQGAR